MSSKPTTTIELPEDLQAFAEERVRTGQNVSVEEVVFEAVNEKRLEVVLAALDAADAELAAGLGKESTIEELMAEIDAESGLSQ